MAIADRMAVGSRKALPFHILRPCRRQAGRHDDDLDAVMEAVCAERNFGPAH